MAPRATTEREGHGGEDDTLLHAAAPDGPGVLPAPFIYGRRRPHAFFGQQTLASLEDLVPPLLWPSKRRETAAKPG